MRVMCVHKFEGSPINVHIVSPAQSITVCTEQEGPRAVVPRGEMGEECSPGGEMFQSNGKIV